MKKVLIIAEYFSPINSIASIRPTKIAKYLKKKNYFIGVLSRMQRINEIADPSLKNDLKYVDEHIIITESIFSRFISYLHKTGNKANSINSNVNKTNQIKKIISNILNFLKFKLKLYYRVLFFLTKSYLKKANIKLKKISKYYDIVITSYGPFSAINLGYIAKSINPNIIWIADFRDPFIHDWLLQDNRSYYTKLKNMIIEKADYITGISDACIEEYKDTFFDKSEVIFNGFDRDDINNLKINENSKFSMLYTGELYRGKRDLRIIFKALYELINESKIDKNNIEVNYLGNNFMYLLEQSDTYKLREICNTYGKVDRVTSLQFQLNSHILLLASWNNDNETGIITGKFYEYMMVNKPILCSISGNLANSQLKQMIKDANIGFTWEQANNNNDYPALKDYIFLQYQRYIAGLPLEFNPNYNYIEQFDYSNISLKFDKIIKCISQ